ncbi:MAG: DJ-1/PfpI family protein [Planctomycetes bacterium]|nr:DJ-1/PfpI family protein [Planctomycetota bacterium]
MQCKEERPVVALLLFDDVEVLDFAGPYEVFAGARDLAAAPLARVFTVAERGEARCHGGLRVIADATFQTCPAFDALVVPGGPGARERRDGQTALIEFIQARKPTAKLIGSVCTGVFLLGRAGLLKGRRATTHSNRLELFAKEFPDANVVAEKLVDEGDVITAGGISSGIDLALYLLDRWFGRTARDREARRLDGPW